MKVVTSPNVDWEPLSIEFASDSQSLPNVGAIRDFIGTWLSQRESTPVCPNFCRVKFLDVREEGAKIKILVQWVCEVCLPKLIEQLSFRFPDIERALIGEPEQRPRTMVPKFRMIEVTARKVTLEDGRSVQVGPLRISAEAVSVADFDAFEQQTGYVSVAERERHLMTYRDNGLLSGYAAADRKSAPAMYLSFEDADAYCQQRCVRLPEDAELLAAITIDDNVRVLVDEERASINLATMPMPLGLTLTGSREGGQIVARRGPWLVKQPGWERAGRYRRLVGPRECVGQFFYCDR